MKNKLAQIADVSQKIGAHPEYVQGGGGNISIKFDDVEMAVKASGFRFGDLKADHGFVSVHYPQVRDFYHSVKVGEDLTSLMEKNNQIVKESVLSSGNEQALRPSMETGFHTLLGRCVLHTHSVYANVLNCSKEGRDLIQKMYTDALFVPYYPPGVLLMLGIKDALNESAAPVLFLENHGLIVQGDTPQEVHDIHESVNARIKDSLGITSKYPTPSVKRITNKEFASDTPYLKEFIRKEPIRIQNMAKTILFPDQVVYGESVGFDTQSNSSIAIDLDSGDIRYTTSLGEAKAFEETFASWVFLLDVIGNLGYTLKTISESDGAFISNMESEKYRKTMI
jgi:rhamnose utilization protein RhaD (predicted bifunctional aldolase and dehydrogenase)